MRLVQHLRATWQTWLVLILPLLLCPMIFPFSQRSQELKCGYVVVLMTVFWITESLPLPVTALIPIVLLPLLGVVSSSRLCKVFFEDIIFLLLGGIIVAIAIEETGLHRRFALRILMAIGVQPRRLLFGIMVTTAFISMWISNTATTAMMMPVTRALLVKMFATTRKVQSGSGCPAGEGQGQTLATTKKVQSDSGCPAAEGESSNTERETIFYTQVTERITPGLDGTEYSQPINGLQTIEDPQLITTIDQSEISKPGTSADTGDDDDKLSNLDPESLSVLKAFSLSVCYCANIGGIATLTGTPPNMVFSRTVADMTREPVVTFASWMTFGFPTAFLILIACYFWMCISAFGYRRILKCETMVTSDEVKRMKQTIQGEYSRLGKIKFSEVIVLLHFFALVVLWMFRYPGTFPGWATFFKPRYVTDGTTAIALAVSLFVFPNTRPNVLFFRRKGDTSQSRSMPAILTWKTTSRKVPWGVLFLLGGGFALSEGIKVSGLSKVIASNVMFMQHMPAWLTCLLVIALTSALTEVSSNTVVAVLLLPMLKNLAAVMRVHPLYLMLPATVASSLAFMLPMATAPNALVFAYGDVKVIDMVKTGLSLNVFGIGVAVLGVNTWGNSLFDLGSFPVWANITSV